VQESRSATRPNELAAEVASTGWYHTIALPQGVVTPGLFDTLGSLPRIPLPEDLTGKRCLDIGTCDGFWAFELERRGASEVVALDLDDSARRDWPDLGIPLETRRADQGRSRQTFEIASRALGSQVERMDLSAYDISTEAVGEFDFVFMGSILLHLRDPVAALESARSVVRGEFMSVDLISFALTLLHPRRPAAGFSAEPRVKWWTPNFAGHKAMLVKAGFRITDSGAPVFLRFGEGVPPDGGSKNPVWRRLGAPCGWIRARPGS
jgi:tRNA (mo5U34)-methyltransferase